MDKRKLWSILILICLVLIMIGTYCGAAVLPHPDHIVLVVEENRSDNQVYGNSNWPTFNGWLATGAKMTSYGGIEHPSYPNYLDLMYGTDLGITDDNATSHTISRYNAPSLGRELLDAGKTFASYSEDLPEVGSEVATSGKYAAKHNVTMRGINAGIASQFRLPATTNERFSDWPSNNFSALPDVSFVIPNLNDDGHDTSDKTADTWLKNNMQSYLDWASAHNSLMIITWDEDEGTGKIATGFFGPMVKPGSYSESIDHYNTLSTIEQMKGVGFTGNAGASKVIGDIWTAQVPEPSCMGPMVVLSVFAYWLSGRHV